MKIHIEVDEKLENSELVIRCPELTNEIMQLQQKVIEICNKKQKILFYQGEKEYYFPVSNILYFETSQDGMKAHTTSEVFSVKHRLYELEELLPTYFVRVSKSSILNASEIYSITKNITASSVVEFQNTLKKVYISRSYYKTIKEIINKNRK